MIQSRKRKYLLRCYARGHTAYAIINLAVYYSAIRNWRKDRK